MISRVFDLNQRYAAAASVARDGVELMAVQDAIGSRFDLATQDLHRRARRDALDVWDQLAGATRVLRWRLITAPLPSNRNELLQSAIEEVSLQVRRIEGAVDDPALLLEIRDSAEAIRAHDPPAGAVLVESLAEVGAETAVVVAASTRSREALSGWLRPLGTRVLTLADLERVEITEDIGYFVGPPRFFSANAVTAPHTQEVTFICPAWFGDRSVPRSAIAEYAEYRVQVATRTIEVGEAQTAGSVQDMAATDPVSEEDLRPHPVWGTRTSEDRAPHTDEVEARKVLLSGGRAIWLDDDGERIRALDPTQPPGERVGYSDVSAVGSGTYLLLREGEAEREALRARALTRVGTHATMIQTSQGSWKSALTEQLRTRGSRESEQALREIGVHAAGQVRSWASEHAIRPQRDADFKLLLAWLGLPVEPYFAHATLLRQEVHRASRELRERLEAAANVVDLHVLEQQGHVTLDIAEPGFKGMFVTKVLAIAPFTELVTRYDARVPFADEGGLWLE